MGTPFISLLEPTRLDAYDSASPHDAQRDAIPPLFIDAMAAREAVFVREQGVPLAHEHDADDARSCHWVAYASDEGKGEGEGEDTAAAATPPSGTRSVPIGTLRIVPFPHPPHPLDGARYVDNVLLPPPAPADSTSPSTPSQPQAPVPTQQLSAVEQERQHAALPFGRDRATTYHDGREPYVKLSRVAVVPEFRGLNIATQLWAAARRWLEAHPDYFDPSVAELGMDQLKAGAPADIPKWNGLVCCHAQESVVGVYERWGFRVDEGMGKWYEEGIPHVGMFARLQVKGSV
ncbi:hypothetical protein F4775DRAFT_586597 [Biscogniauxia sp. FL1348]|nr:hypothetical protein F4775DRAFT_586597 [Biscogniauxia sp. FL1348]